MAAIDCGRLQKAMDGCRRLSKAAIDYSRLQKAMDGCNRLPKAAINCRRLQAAAEGCRRSAIVLCRKYTFSTSSVTTVICCRPCAALQQTATGGPGFADGNKRLRALQDVVHAGKEKEAPAGLQWNGNFKLCQLTLTFDSKSVIPGVVE